MQSGGRRPALAALGAFAGVTAALCAYALTPSPRRTAAGAGQELPRAPAPPEQKAGALPPRGAVAARAGAAAPAHPPQSAAPAQRGGIAGALPLWFERQWAAAGESVRREVERREREGGTCMSGFRAHFSTRLDPAVPFRPDPQALLLQAELYRRQFCDPRKCAATLYQMTKPFQGLGSRYHTHLCSLDHAVRSNRPFVSLDGGWIFTEPADCPNSNDDCYFNKFTGCPQRFCTQARDGEQKCARPAPPPATQQCGATCLCGDCGVKDDKHELVWARHSCNDLRDAPLPEGANRSHLWWTAQALFFMLQPGAALNAELERDIRSFPAFAHPVINMHVRRGRLKQPEMARFFALDEYTKVAEPFVRRLGLARPRAFIQTNEPAVITETRSFPKWQWGYTEWNRTGMDLQIHNDPRKVKRRKARGWWTDARKWTMHSLRNLWLMVRSDYWVCTFSSNWCRLALRLAYATYGRLPPTISLDAWGFDPYTWYKNAYVRQVAIALGEDWP